MTAVADKLLEDFKKLAPDEQLIVRERVIFLTEGHPREAKGFVEHANQLVKIGRIDAALDLVYDQIDTFLVNRKFEDVDSVLRDVKPERLSVDILLGLLTCTLPAKTKLSTRAAFFAEVEREIKKRGEWEEGLLTGLEN